MSHPGGSQASSAGKRATQPLDIYPTLVDTGIKIQLFSMHCHIRVGLQRVFIYLNTMKNSSHPFLLLPNKILVEVL